MTIVHDAFLFKPDMFFKTIFPYVLAMEDVNKGYNDLRAAALHAMEENSNSKWFAKEYGGWSQDAIKSQIPVDKPSSMDDIAFWLVILLYCHLVIEKYQLGLGHDFDLLDNILQILNWNKDQRELLIWGHSFKDLPTKVGGVDISSMIQKNIYHSVWGYIKPFSTASRAGWINADEIALIQNNLIDANAKFLNTSNLKTDQSIAVFEAANRMLSSARNLNSGLCLIVSG